MLLPVDLMMEGKFSAIVLKEKENEFLSSAFFFLFSKTTSFRNTISVSNNLYPDQARHFGTKLFARVSSR